MSLELKEKNIPEQKDVFLSKSESQALQMIKTKEYPKLKDNFLKACEKKFAIPEKIAYLRNADSYESFQIILQWRFDKSWGKERLKPEDIGLIQAYLNAKWFVGADQKPLVVDGIAGKNTYNAIKNYFQNIFPEFKFKKDVLTAENYEKNKEFEKAFQIYDRLRQQFPANIVFINGAIRAFDSMSVNDGKQWSEVTKKIEDIYTSSKHKRKLDLYLKWVEAEPNNTQILSLAATELYYDWKPQEANNLFQRVFENGWKLENVALLYPLAETVLAAKYSWEHFNKVFDIRSRTLNTDWQSTKIDLAKNALLLEDGSSVTITPKEHGPASYQLLLSVAREINKAKAANQTISSSRVWSQIDSMTKNLV